MYEREVRQEEIEFKRLKLHHLPPFAIAPKTTKPALPVSHHHVITPPLSLYIPQLATRNELLGYLPKLFHALPTLIPHLAVELCFSSHDASQGIGSKKVAAADAAAADAGEVVHSQVAGNRPVGSHPVGSRLAGSHLADTVPEEERHILDLRTVLVEEGLGDRRPIDREEVRRSLVGGLVEGLRSRRRRRRKIGEGKCCSPREEAAEILLG